MKVFLCGVVLSFSLALAVYGQDAPFPKKALPPINLNRGGAVAVVDLSGLFGLENVTGPLAKFEFNVGSIYTELYPDVTPQTVANFLKYSSSGKYDATFLHRSIPGFVVQGGGYYYGGENYVPVEKDSPVRNEFALPNVPGTIAMAKIAGNLDSATSEWYFNNADNSGPEKLDAPDQKFTVFGRLLGGGRDFMDAVNRLPTTDLNGGNPNGPFRDVPYVTLSGGPSLVALETLREVPLLRLPATAPGYLAVTAVSSDPEVVQAEIKAAGLELKSGANVGSAQITLAATDPWGQFATVSFAVASVNSSLPIVTVRALQATATEAGRAGLIRLQRTGSRKNRLVVRLNLGGSTARYGNDYPAFVTSTIPAGKGSVDLWIRPRNDKAKEGLESVVVTVLERPVYTIAPEQSASVTILDSDVPNVTMRVLVPTATEKSSEVALVQFTRTGPVKTALRVPFALAGTARDGTDYAASSNEALIPVGSATTTVSFKALGDTIHEGPETIEVNPTRSKSYNILTPSASVTVLDSL